jgi:hypothetical protein
VLNLGDADGRAIKAIQAFVQAGTWVESQRIAKKDSVLLTDRSLELLERLIAAAREQGDERAERILTEHSRLIERCQQVGIALAFGEKMAGAPGEGDLPAGIGDVLRDIRSSGEPINSLQDLEAILSTRPALQERVRQAAEHSALPVDTPPELAGELNRAIAAREAAELAIGAERLPALDSAAYAWGRWLESPRTSRCVCT